MPACASAGLHHGLGRGCGAVLGGIAVAKWGTTRTFAGYGLLCTVVLAAFAFVNFRGAPEEAVVDDEARAVAEAGVLAPHGVPSNPLPRALSSTRLADLAHHDSYGATQVGSAPPRSPRPQLARTNPSRSAELRRRGVTGGAGAGAGAAALQPVPGGAAGRARLQIGDSRRSDDILRLIIFSTVLCTNIFGT